MHQAAPCNELRTTGRHKAEAGGGVGDEREGKTDGQTDTCVCVYVCVCAHVHVHKG